MGRLCPNNKMAWLRKVGPMKRQWPLTWCKDNHTRGTDCKYNPVGQNPKMQHKIMGRLALASKILTKGDWPEVMQSMQWGKLPRSKSTDENGDFALSTRGTYLQYKIRLPLA